MIKKPPDDENDSNIDPEMIRQFMLGGTDLKDEKRGRKSKTEVDLHLDETTRSYDLLSGNEKLNTQLKHLEKQIDRAITNGCAKLDVIHGKGDGKLRDAVHSFLRNHPQVKSFHILNDRKHEGGATEVFFK